MWPGADPGARCQEPPGRPGPGPALPAAMAAAGAAFGRRRCPASRACAPPCRARARRPFHGNLESAQHIPPQNGAGSSPLTFCPHAEPKRCGVFCPTAHVNMAKVRVQGYDVFPVNALWPGALPGKSEVREVASLGVNARGSCARANGSQMPLAVVALRETPNGKPPVHGLRRQDHSPIQGTPAPYR